MNRIILASASPRRRTLLKQIGIPCEVRISQREELTGKTLPWEMVEELSLRKAEDICARIQEDAADAGRADGTVPGESAVPGNRTAVIGADTVVVFEGQVLGKPRDAADARRMLSLLQGNTHQVYTGVTLAVGMAGGESSATGPEASFTFHSFHEKTDVTMYPMTPEETEEYIATGEPMDKAGAYGIQGKCAAFIKSICGDYNNVVGLPVGRLYQEMKAGNLL